jgi:transcriptional antiterminator NusG
MTEDDKNVTNGARKLRWYVLRVATGYEQRVSVLVADLVVRKGLQDYVGEVLVPTEHLVELKAGQKRRSQRKFFPGYVLIQVVMNDEVCLDLRNLTHVLGFVGGSRGNPVPVPQLEIDRILNRLEGGGAAKTEVAAFEPGESVNVIEGPFADFHGVVEDVNQEKKRLTVSVLIFGRATPVELEFSQVEKV